MPIIELVKETVMLQLPTARLGTLRLSAVAPAISVGVLVTSAQVPPMLGEATFMFVNAAVKLALVSGPKFALVNMVGINVVEVGFAHVLLPCMRCRPRT